MNTKIITFCVFATLFMGAYVALCCFQPDKANPALVLSIAFAVVAFLCFIYDLCKECCMSCCCKSIKELEGKIAEQQTQIAEAKHDVEKKILPENTASADEVIKHNKELQALLEKFTKIGGALTEIKTSIDDVKAELGKPKQQ